MGKVALLLVVLLGCGAPEKKAKSEPEHGADPAKAGQLLEEAQKKTAAGSWAEARELLREAYRFSDMQTRVRIDAAGERLDDAQAKAVGTEVVSSVEEDRCGDAFDLVGKTVDETRDAQVPGILKKATEAALVGCVREAVEAGELAEARALMSRPSVASALDKKARSELATEVSDTIVATVLGRMTPAMDLRDWVESSQILQAAVDAGEVGDGEREVLLTQVRAGIAADVEKLAKESFGQDKGAEEALAKIDAILAAGMWKPRADAANRGPMSTEEKMLAQADEQTAADETRPLVPEQLHRLRRELAFWVACRAVKCEEVAPAERWLYGNTWLYPLLSPKVDTEDSLDHATKVWILAEGGSLALVSMREPGKVADLAARAHVGAGWVPAKALKAEDTSTWLPPGDSIIGTRVWGPLREGSKNLELGTAMKVDGANVAVERMSDAAIVTVPRGQLHFGLVTPGTKVLALCEGMTLRPARVEKVDEPKHRSLGAPKVTLVCLDPDGNDGTKYEEQLGAVRIERGWLPPRR